MKNKKTNSVIQQANKLIKHNRQGSYETKRRYSQAYFRFCNFLVDEFKLQNIKNIRPKHIEVYVDYLIGKNVSESYIKTELAAIRFFHDRIDKPRYNRLPTNDELNIDRRSYRGIDRKWSKDEIDTFKKISIEKNKPWIADTVDIASILGFRLHEVIRLDRKDLEDALRNNFIEIKGKGGRIRKVPLKDEIKPLFERLIRNTPKNSKIFVKEGEKAHNIHKEIQCFIRENRNIIREDTKEDNRPNLTFHGLRHTFANEEYKNAIESDLKPLDAEKKVSKLLGHNRAEVTRIYINKKKIQ